MGWEEYYKEVRPVSFGESRQAYLAVVDRLRFLNPNFLNPQNPAKFVLGGFHPALGTPYEFEQFCRQIHQNQEDKIIYLDMNLHPLEQLNNEIRLQARLEQLPFSPGSIDMIILDFTCEFMSDSQIQDFAKRAKECLTENGVVIVSIGEPLLKENIEEFLWRFKNKVRTYIHSFEKLTNLIETHLRLIARVEYEVRRDLCSVLVFTRQESNFPQSVGFLSLVRE